MRNTLNRSTDKTQIRAEAWRKKIVETCSVERHDGIIKVSLDDVTSLLSEIFPHIDALVAALEKCIPHLGGNTMRQAEQALAKAKGVAV